MDTGSLLEKLGVQLGRAIAAGFKAETGAGSVVRLKSKKLPRANLSRKSSKKTKGPTWSGKATAAKTCPVKGCVHPSVVHGICRNHYGKARRMKMRGAKTGTFSVRDMKALALDGRKVA